MRKRGEERERERKRKGGGKRGPSTSGPLIVFALRIWLP